MGGVGNSTGNGGFVMDQLKALEAWRLMNELHDYEDGLCSLQSRPDNEKVRYSISVLKNAITDVEKRISNL